MNIAALIPPNAISVLLAIQDLSGTVNVTGQTVGTLLFKLVTGVTMRTFTFNWQGLSNAGEHVGSGMGDVTLPNLGQSYIYQLTQSQGTAPSTTHDCVGYTVPNGGE